MKSIKITDTTFRDAHQSLAATRMRTRHMIPLIEKMDDVGFFSLEVWGGATFDSCIRYLNEDPWDRIRIFKKYLKNTPTQMLLRGQNLVGYKHYSDDIVEKFVEKSFENGVDIFRIFDALNDIRNMGLSIKVAKRIGAHVQGTICYTISPVHTTEKFVEMAKQLEELECDSLCIKDMAGLISPSAAYELVNALKKEISIPIALHSHCTSGMAPISYYAAVKAGVDILDTAMSPFSWGTSQPPTETIVAALKGTAHDTGIKQESFRGITEIFREIRTKYSALIDERSQMIDTNVLLYQIPGGMISNLISQLREQNALDRFEDVLKEIPKVREELGYPPLVTPTSQIVGTQAVMNVLVGERYKVVPQEIKDYVKGLYGRPPAPIKEEIKLKIIGDEEPIIIRPADLIPPMLHLMEEEARKLGIVRQEEDILTYALYPSIAPRFLKGEFIEEPLKPSGEEEKDREKGIPTEFKVEIDDEEFFVRVKPLGGFVDVVEAKHEEKAEKIEGAIVSPMQGMIVKIKVNEGDMVKKDDVVALLEAMKMQNDIVAIRSGKVKKVFISEGDSVAAGDVIIAVK